VNQSPVAVLHGDWRLILRKQRAFRCDKLGLNEQVMFKKVLLSKYKKPQTISAALVVLAIAAAGTYLIISGHAATPYASVNASQGNLTGSAALQTDSSTSSGKYVQFGTASTGGSNKGVPWVGLNDFTGWGPPLTSYYLADGFKWARLGEMGGGYTPGNDVDAALSDGCNVVIILPTDTNEAMSWMNAYKSYGSRVVYEFWNEPWTSSNGTPVIPAGTYAQDYEAAYNAKHAAGITQPLLFMTIGALADNGPMWLATAMQTVPGLKVDAFSAHPYGEVNDDSPNNNPNVTPKHSYGVKALIALHQDAVNRGFSDTPWYVTEYGFTLNPSQSGSGGQCVSSGQYVPSYAEQANQLTLAYNKMITLGDGVAGTWLKGIMWYQTHDDSTGWFGLLTSPTSASQDANGTCATINGVTNNNAVKELTGNDSSGANTPITPRPAYTALKAFITNH